jgi:SAM-dependent methyltransferase
MAAGFFHHLADPDAHIALSEARRVLKPSGKMLALTAIWPLSKWNLIGWTVRKLDRGEYIRTYDEFSRIFSVHFAIEKHYPFRMLLWDLVAFILLPKKTTSRYRL